MFSRPAFRNSDFAPTQTFAGVISLLNDFRLSQGKSPLGFLNPLIYSTGATGFNDITSGSNPGCGTNGFTAGAGWDPVSRPFPPTFGGPCARLRRTPPTRGVTPSLTANVASTKRALSSSLCPEA